MLQGTKIKGHLRSSLFYVDCKNESIRGRFFATEFGGQQHWI